MSFNNYYDNVRHDSTKHKTQLLETLGAFCFFADGT